MGEGEGWVGERKRKKRREGKEKKRKKKELIGEKEKVRI